MLCPLKVLGIDFFGLFGGKNRDKMSISWTKGSCLSSVEKKNNKPLNQYSTCPETSLLSLISRCPSHPHAVTLELRHVHELTVTVRG